MISCHGQGPAGGGISSNNRGVCTCRKIMKTRCDRIVKDGDADVESLEAREWVHVLDAPVSFLPLVRLKHDLARTTAAAATAMHELNHASRCDIRRTFEDKHVFDTSSFEELNH